MKIKCPNCGHERRIFPGSPRVLCGNCNWSAFLAGDEYHWRPGGYQQPQEEIDADAAYRMIVAGYKHSIGKYRRGFETRK